MPAPLIAGSLVLIAMAVAAFWPQYLAKPLGTVDPYTHAHALLGVAWLVLLIVQPLAIRRGARTLHRTLGRLSYLLAPAFVVSGVLLAHHRFSRMARDTFLQEAFSLYLPVLITALFAMAWGLAVAYRHRTPLHARFMACTGLLLIDPVVGRILFFYFPPLPNHYVYQGITFTITSGLIYLMLRSLPTPGPARVVLGRFLVFVIGVQALWFFLPNTQAWLAFATWFRGLPLT